MTQKDMTPNGKIGSGNGIVELKIVDLIRGVCREKWTIIIVTIVTFFIGIIYLISRPDVYEATVTVTPVNAEENLGSFNASGLGSIAGLAGLDLGGAENRTVVIAKELLKSNLFLSDFIANYNIDVGIYAATGWDRQKAGWIYDNSIYDKKEEEWKLDENGKTKRPKEIQAVQKFREENLSVTEHKDTKIIKITVRSLSPKYAQIWAKKLVEDLNKTVKKRELSKSEKRIEYLKKEVGKTELSGVTEVIYKVLESEIRKVTLAYSQKEFVFEVIDPPVEPIYKSGPNRLAIVILSGFLAIILGVLVGTTKYSYRRVVHGAKPKSEHSVGQP